MLFLTFWAQDLNSIKKTFRSAKEILTGYTFLNS